MPNDLTAILESAAFAPLEGRAFLRITGEDRTRWLNGMVTNSMQSLAAGEGSYNFLLNAQGRIQADATIYHDGAEFLLETSRDQIERIQQHLDRFIIMDDVELMPIMDDQDGLVLAGPSAADRLTSLSLPAPQPLHLARAMYAGQPILLLTPSPSIVPQFEIWAAPQAIAAIRIGLDASATVPVPPDTFEKLRILSGVPRFGADIRDKDLPQETAQTHALHFSKGCYLGQEIVERIRSRGQVHRTFAAFQLAGTLPSLPASLALEGKPVGEITSATNVEDHLLALGYVRRDALLGNPVLTYDGGTATPRQVTPQAPSSNASGDS